MDQVTKNPSGGGTNELDPNEFAPGQGSLDPHERFGQGPDLSHPETATDGEVGGQVPFADDEDSSISKQPYAP